MDAEQQGPKEAGVMEYGVAQYGMENGPGIGQGTAGKKGGHTLVSRLAPNPQQPKQAPQAPQAPQASHAPQAQSPAQLPPTPVRMGAQASEVYAGVSRVLLFFKVLLWWRSHLLSHTLSRSLSGAMRLCCKSLQ